MRMFFNFFFFQREHNSKKKNKTESFDIVSKNKQLYMLKINHVFTNENRIQFSY